MHRRDTQGTQIAADSGGSVLENRREHTLRFLREAEVEIKRLDREIAWIQESAKDLGGLMKERDTLATRVIAIRADMHPPTRIPPEILAVIFESVVRQDWYGKLEVILPPRQAHYHWRLGQVCSYWRQVLWNTPRLWRVISLYFPYPTPRYVDRVHQSIHYILSKIEGSFSLDIQYCGEDLPLKTLFLPVVSRFRSITIDTLTYQSFRELLNFPPASFTSLETLHIVLPVINQALFRDISSLHSAHNLKDLSIIFNDPDTTFALSTFPLPWKQLTTITAQQVDCDDDWNTMSFLLENCSAMTQLNLSIIGEFPYDVDPLNHESLKLLNLTIYIGIDWDEFFRPYTFPSLTSLTILGEYVSDDWSPGALSSLIERSNCKIESLVIGGKPLILDEESEVYFG